MIKVKQFTNNLIVTKGDTIIKCDYEKEDEKSVKIPEPVLPNNLTKGQEEVLKKETRTITSVEFSKSGDYLVVSTENKQVIVFDNQLQVIRNFIVPRAASKACFTAQNDILVADKTGDVYLYKLENVEEEPMLILGHLSVILDLVVSNCGRFIITCDRDEKIRVSHFPNAYNIASYCLGHKEFVTALRIVQGTLISASGDGTIRFWDFINGRELGQIDTNSNIDKKLLEAFALEMDKEKVDVLALPITDMQLHESYNLFIIAAIHKCNFLQLYATDLKSCKSIFVRRIETVSANFGFSFASNLFIVGQKILFYKLINENYEFVENQYIENVLLKKLHCIKDSEDSGMITVLYKRKFDNVQEYLERKRLRLENK